MTLVLAIPAADGIVMASDGQLTMGLVRSKDHKIYRLNDRCAWSAAGEVALIQRVQERMKALADACLSTLRDSIGQIVKQCLVELMQLDFRVPLLPQEPEVLLRLHPGDFVFAQVSPKRYLLHITAYGTPEWIQGRAFASGVGAVFAYALLQKYQDTALDVERASVLAYKVIEEAIEVGAYGLGPPVDIWQVKKDGVSQLDEARLVAINDTATAIREAEIELLTRKE